ncbi:MAG: uroporphyrinogen-III synthase, partial [Planctomycetes bacterium]|nr:uroporphyrinogen-III synthase [Planctomycetota bacterium]
RPLVGDPLRSVRVATIRPDGERTGLTAAMAIAGAEVTALGWTETVALPTTRAALDQLLATAALAFTSARAVRHFVAACAQHGLQPFARPTFAVGAATATELVQAGFVDVRPAGGRGGAALAAACAEAGVASVGMPCAEDRHDGFERHAQERGVAVSALPVYRLVDAPTRTGLPTELDAFVFTSPSAVRAFRDVGDGRTDLRAIAIGATTAEALHAAGFATVTALPEPTPAALIDALTHGPRP